MTEIKVRAGKGEYFQDVNSIVIDTEKESITLSELLKKAEHLEEENKKLIKYLKDREESELQLKLLMNKSIDLLSRKVARIEKQLEAKK